MKKLSLLALLTIIFSCNSVQKYNRQRETKLPPEKLKQDVDYAYKKLKELHPNLFWYVSEKDLNKKFDSLKLSITDSLSPVDFYFKIQPAVADIREGHLAVRIPGKRYSGKEIRTMKNKKGLFGRLDYYVENQKLYVLTNKDSIENILPGTEILAINDVPVEKFMKKYRKLMTSDGYNSTFYPYYLKDSFFNYYSAENGFLDSAKIETKYEDVIKTVNLTRESKSEADKEKDKAQKKGNTEKRTNDYVAATDSYNRSFKYLDQDSTIAYIKVKSFSKSYSERFYRETFQKIKDKKATHLVIDVRENYGGSLSEINNLYSYLAKEPFKLVNKPEMTSKYSPLKTNYFRKTSPIGYLVKGIMAPFIFTRQLFVGKKGKDGKAYYSMKHSKETKPKETAFQGKVYVLINGGSFSASSIITSKLKNDKRAILVGEETGGANDGTVAGFYSYQSLPNSKLQLPIGVLFIQPNIDFTNTKKGVTPNVEILNSFESTLNKEDPQLEWVKAEIEKEKAGI
ncbi:S41 family peptidase [Chryseobacterium caseinilyticum]|uniref:S41 family peptidase n=1 Tax=Chryseobacterium caseinilyticum TaxID=2771428 RepID=A0ABR8Z9T4_9FLAO|nr:S41 family peptidase [Chryseobacterium caseinilyticum]MBD8082012.1 S41 family peptidase [Chryseobacterium caseinilyticum]